MKSVEARRAMFVRAAFILLAWVVGLSGTTLAQGLPDAPPRADVRIAVISDLNSSYGSTDYEPEVPATLDLIIHHWKADLVLCAGDMIAGQHLDLTEDNLRAMWAAFDSTVAQPLRRAGVPFGFTVGNHDASGSGRFEHERKIAADYWRDPRHAPGTEIVGNGRFPFYYAFVHDSLYVVSLDASHAGTLADEPQMAWLEETLKSPEARKAALRIAIGHLPAMPVADGRQRPGEFLNRGSEFLEKLSALGVDVYVSGHHHAYFLSRSHGIDLLYAGVLGQGQRVLIGEDEPLGQTVTLMDVDYAGPEVRYTTYRLEVRDGERILQEVALDELPERIESEASIVRRHDLVRESEASVKKRELQEK